MIKTRLYPWTCSKFANWIRGEKKPAALSWGDWTKWKETQKKDRPFRFWISDTGLRYLQDFIYFPYDLYRTIKVYCRNRWVDKIHYLKTGLQPGEYYDLDYRILHGLFNELVDFVEIDLAHLSLWDRNKRYKFKNGRCIEAAYDYFEWANNLTDTIGKNKKVSSQQAKSSRKIKKLYEWWKIERPQRKHPYSDPSLGDIEDILDNKKYKKKEKLYDKAYEIEQQQELEDTKMLIELIKLRHHLWT